MTAEIGRYISLEWQEWMHTEEGERCRNIETVGTDPKYLQNRLEAAFNAGANAVQKYFETRKEST